MRILEPFARALCLVALGLALACGSPDDEPAATADLSVEPPPQPRALWVLCEGSQRVLEHPDRIPVLIEQAKLLGATDLFVQVYRGGRAWFDSTRADPGPYQEMLARGGGDGLAQLIEQAHAAGLSVHAWVNALSLARNRDAPIVSELGREAVLVDRHGRSILDYPKLDVPAPDRRYYRMGTPGVYLDAASPGVAEYLAETFGELMLRYPELDGLHLDYIRYPDVLPFAPGSRFGVGLDFGYGEPTRARFRQETGLEAPFGDSTRNANAWDAWRRDQVTRVVRLTRAAVDASAPGAKLSAAVWTYADRGYLVIGQDWRGWLDDGLLDFAVPMAYTLDDRLLRYLLEDFAGSPRGDRIWAGLGSWLFAARPAGAVAQLAIADAAGSHGVALFSYDSIAEHPALLEALAREAAGAE